MSELSFDAFNLAAHVDDRIDAVVANRATLQREWPGSVSMQWLTQVHGASVVYAASATCSGTAPEADACWTDQPGIACAVLVADCLPLLLASREGRCVAAVHAGWRGLVAGVIEAAVAAMPCDASDLLAWLGPCIGPCHFRVGPEVAEEVSIRQPGNAGPYLSGFENTGHCHVDLQGLAAARLASLGVPEVARHPACTVCDSDRFFSYRRDGKTGRQAALIALR